MRILVYYLTSVFGWDLTNIVRVLACVLSWLVVVLRCVDVLCSVVSCYIVLYFIVSFCIVLYCVLSYCVV